MTIALGTLRPTFAVLAADRLSRITQEDGTLIEVREVSKIVSHPSLPLACTVAGLAYLPADMDSGVVGWPPVTDHISGVFRSIDRNGLFYRNVACRLWNRIGPLIVTYRTGKGDSVRSHIGLVSGGKADGAFITIEERVFSCANDLHGWIAPHETHACVGRRLGEVTALTEPDGIAEALADIVREAIRTEGGKTIGFGINTAIITDKGVQLCQHPL
jgi:hypothetical protein